MEIDIYFDFKLLFKNVMLSLMTRLALLLIAEDFKTLNSHKIILEGRLENLYLLQGTNLFDRCMCI
jgi:hypothetical protein